MERVLTEQMETYLYDNNLYSNIQFGFRKNFSTSEALLYATECFRKETDSNNLTAVALLDLSKAFDSIQHNILYQKLENIGIEQNAIELIKSFLTDRQQRVKVNNVYSDWIDLSQGVPQGTVLGPLLFNLYVNDMLTCVEDCKLVQYADDTCIFISGKNIDEIC